MFEGGGYDESARKRSAGEKVGKWAGGRLIGQGESTGDIAQKLNLKTVEVYRFNIKNKLKLTTASELIHFTVRWMQSNPTVPKNNFLC